MHFWEYILERKRRLEPGLLGQFIIASLVVTVAVGLGLAWLAGKTITDAALGELEDEARNTLATRVAAQLTLEDLQQPMTGERYDEFHHFVDQSIYSERTARIKVWNRQGQIIYSDDPEQVGQSYPTNDDFQVALGGETISHLSGLSKPENVGEREYGQLLEVYTPIVLPGSQETAGALEIYQDYGAIAGHIQRTRLLVFAGLGGGLGILWIALTAIVANGAHTIARQRDSLIKTQARADTDSLTGVYNHGYLQAVLSKQIEHAGRQGVPLSIILLDIDSFKLFNSTYGHLQGDTVLKLTAESLVQSCRSGDIVGRYGGDEFLVILPGADRAEAVKIAERIVAAIDHLEIHPRGGVERLPLAISGGIAVYPDDSQTKEGLIAHADAALYDSKQTSGSGITAGDGLRNRERVVYPVGAFGVLDGLVRAVDRKDRYTKAHSDADAVYAVILAKALGLSKQSQETVRIAALLHDIGKVGIPDDILMKPGPLTEEERGVMQQHALLSERIIGGVPHVPEVRAAAASHHERWDGTGYPRGLRGEEIPLLGRVLAIADAYSAMTLDRPYRKAMPRAEALREIRQGAGSQFDPHMVEVFIEKLSYEGDTDEAVVAAQATGVAHGER